MKSLYHTEKGPAAEGDPREQAKEFLEKAREEFEAERLRLLREAEEEARFLKEKAREEVLQKVSEKVRSKQPGC